MKHFTFFLSFFCLTSCGIFKERPQQDISHSQTEQSKKEEKEVFTPVKKQVYITNKAWASEYSDPNGAIMARIDSVYEFGKLLTISAESKHFYKVEEETRNDLTNYIRKADTGDWKALKKNFTDKLLEEVFSFGDEPSNKNISNYFSITLIPEAEYKKALANKISYISWENLGVIEQKDALTLPTEKKKVRFKGERDISKPKPLLYEYNGFLKDLNQYLVLMNSFIYDEYQEFILVDKTTGEKCFIEQFPIVTPDKKYLVGLENSRYWRSYGVISLYKIVSLSPFRIECVVNERPKWWCFTGDEAPVFVTQEGILYAGINPNGGIQENNFTFSSPELYIKITIKKKQ